MDRPTRDRACGAFVGEACMWGFGVQGLCESVGFLRLIEFEALWFFGVMRQPENSTHRP